LLQGKEEGLVCFQGEVAHVLKCKVIIGYPLCQKVQAGG
jgi:hypothetical protein